jgi:hypothetical protein
MWHAKEGTEMYTGFWWEFLKIQDYLRDPGIDVSVKLKWMLK